MIAVPYPRQDARKPIAEGARVGHVILVIAQTMVPPIVSGVVELAVIGGDPILVLGKWWVS